MSLFLVFAGTTRGQHICSKHSTWQTATPHRTKQCVRSQREAGGTVGGTILVENHCHGRFQSCTFAAALCRACRSERALALETAHFVVGVEHAAGSTIFVVDLARVCHEATVVGIRVCGVRDRTAVEPAWCMH